MATKDKKGADAAPKSGSKGKKKGDAPKARGPHAGSGKPVPPPRLRMHYQSTVRKRLMDQFGLKNPHQVPTLTKIVDRMVTNSLVYRSPDEKDRRRILIFMTPRGKATHERIQRIADDQQNRLQERLQGQQYEQLKSLLESLSAQR